MSLVGSQSYYVVKEINQGNGARWERLAVGQEKWKTIANETKTVQLIGVN